MSGHRSFENVRAFYESELASRFGVPVGCSAKEVADFETTSNMKLPEVYKQFLYWMGNDYRGVFQGTNIFLTDLPGINLALPALLAENSVQLANANTMFCFLMHQGYTAAWFHTSASQCDPECFLYSEVFSSRTPKSVGSFSDFLLSEFEAFA